MYVIDITAHHYVWRIIRAAMPDGTVEFQVSDGPVGKRSTSYDFDNLQDAQKCLEALRTGEMR